MTRNTRMIACLAAVLIGVGMLGMASYTYTQRLIAGNAWVVHTHQVLENVGDVLVALTDAETGQRGFMLTGQERYLEPYTQAIGVIHGRIGTLIELTRDTPDQQTALHKLTALSDAKLRELQQTIELRRRSGLAAAMPLILSNSGKQIMDDIRSLTSQMERRERQLLQQRQQDADRSSRLAIWTIAGGIPLSLLLLTVAALLLVQQGRLGGSGLQADDGSSSWRRLGARYAFAALAVILAAVFRAWMLRIGPLPLFVTFYPAVLLVATVAGGGPGIVASVLSALAATYWFMQPYGHFSIAAASDVLALAIFTGANLALCVVVERLHRARWAEAFGLAKQQEAEELAQKNEELARQAEELSQQSEELSRQNEELQTQSEELVQQNGELQAQSEEIQALNGELTGRESMLQKLLDAARLASGEESVLNDVCAAAKEMFGPAAAAVVAFERQGDQLFIRAQAGLSAAQPKSLPLAGTFVGAVIGEGRTAALNDIALRPDLQLLRPVGQDVFRGALAAPVQVQGKPFGMVTVYSSQAQDWTAEKFRLTEWLAAQCGHILDTLRLQDQLRQTAEQNQLLSDLLEHAEQPFGIGYPDGRLGHVNGAFERLTGYSRAELGAMDWTQVLTPPEWRQVERSQLEALTRSGQPVRYEKEYIRKDGSRVPIELLVHLVKDSAGAPLYYFSFLTDLTERKRAEAERDWVNRQRQIALDAARMGWWHYDPVTKVSMWDERYKEIFEVSGYQRPNEEILARLHPDDLARVWAAAEAALNPLNPQPYSIEYRIKLPDGSVRWVEAHGAAAFDGEGRDRHATSFVGTVADITERRRAEDALQTTVAELARSNRELEQFTYVSSHDLQEPLRMVTAFTGLLRDRYQGKLDAQADTYIGFALEGATRMQTLISDLLAYACVGAKPRALALTPVQGRFDAALANLKTVIASTGARITQEPLPTIMADGLQLTQVFQNLISNAIKYCAPGVTPEIHVGATRVSGPCPGPSMQQVQGVDASCADRRTRDEDSSSWVFSIRDNGIGIEAQYFERIFGFFQRLHARDEYPGSGVGLAICRKIVEQCGGRIWVESQLGKGSTFRFSLPE